MSLENSNPKMYSVDYTIGDVQYTITDTEEVHSRLESGKYIYVYNMPFIF